MHSYLLQPIDWSYPVRPANMTKNYIILITILSLMFIVYVAALIIGNSYLRRRKKGIKRFYECDVTYKHPEDEEDASETLYITTYGVLDIKMFFMRFAKVKVKRIKNPEDFDFIDLDNVIEAQKDITSEDIIDNISEESDKIRDNRDKEN